MATTIYNNNKTHVFQIKTSELLFLKKTIERLNLSIDNFFLNNILLPNVLCLIILVNCRNKIKVSVFFGAKLVRVKYL